MTPVPFLLALASTPWIVPPAPDDPLGALRPTPEQLIAPERSRRTCGFAVEGEIIVCAIRSRYREQFEPTPGERHRLVAGEAPSAMDALTMPGPGQMQGIDMIGIAKAIGRGLDRLLHPD
jgi:hypothetical protein